MVADRPASRAREKRAFNEATRLSGDRDERHGMKIPIRKQGFTLIEILVVIAIIGILIRSMIHAWVF